MQINPILYQNEINKVPDIQKDYLDIKNRLISQEDNKSSIFETLEEQAPWYGKIAEATNELEDKNYIPATGLISLAVLNGPEDVRDAMDIWRQFKNKFKPTKSWISGYDNKYAQHPYSFFRGTVLSDVLNPYSEDCPSPKWATKIIRADKTLWDTKLGNWVQKKFGIKTFKVKTDIKEIDFTLKNLHKVLATGLKSPNKFADITARAMLRTPILGVGALGLVEASDIIHEVKNGKNFFEETGKSLATLGTTLLATGVLGAIGSKHYGAVGSLAGTTLGALTSATVSNIIDSDS